jgi:SAM-dependent methyltransferase
VSVKLKWRSGTVALRCAVCDRVDGQQRVATVAVPGRHGRTTVARCGGCTSIIIDGLLPPDDAYSDAHWDWDQYIEHGAGIEAIAALVASVDAPAGSRLLDVGCGYGFALDLGAFLCDWTGIGLDPSPAAERGQRDLQLDIRRATLDADFAHSERFDVIVASEVLEHLVDPRTLLREIARRLERDGVGVITTPNADFVRPEIPSTTLLSVLSLGHHVFVPTQESLRAMLDDTGLLARVTPRGHSLFGVMSPTTAGLARVRENPSVPLTDLASYCRTRAAAAPEGSALAVGMTTRAIKFLAYDGRFAEAAEMVEHLRGHLLARHGVDLDDRAALRSLAAPPPIVAAAGYFSGVTARYVDQDPDLADARWTAAVAAGAAHYARAGRYAQPEIARFEMEALGERALLHSSADPVEARRLLSQLDAAARRSGDHSVASAYRPRVEADLGPEPVRTSTSKIKFHRIAAGIRRRFFRNTSRA